MELDKEITLTSVYRSLDEQLELYKDVPKDKIPMNSPHMRWEATDLRSSDFTEAEIKRILDFLLTFRYSGGQKPVALYHMIAGNVPHFHIQYA